MSKKGPRQLPYENYDDEEKIEEELRGRKVICSCEDDPDWCPKHGGWE